MKTKTLFLQLPLSKIKFLLTIFFFTYSYNAYTQECLTPDIQPEEAMNYPGFGNPDYLPAFMDSLIAAENIPSQNPNINSIVPNIKWRIPIKFWIFTQGI